MKLLKNLIRILNGIVLIFMIWHLSLFFITESLLYLESIKSYRIIIYTFLFSSMLLLWYFEPIDQPHNDESIVEKNESKN
jgi:hypothetical protein